MLRQSMSIKISNQGLSPTFKTKVVDEFNQWREVNIAGETPLVISIDGQEIVTLMTLGTHPEALVLGYLRNQRFISTMDELVSIEVNWATESAKVVTKAGIENLSDKVAKRIVTTGCGQGTVFSCTMDEILQSTTGCDHTQAIHRLRVAKKSQSNTTKFTNLLALYTVALYVANKMY